MTSETFLFRVVLSFLVGGIYIAVMSRLAERFGSKLGGLLIALPSVALISLCFIAWEQGAVALKEATSVMPATIASSTIFLVVFSLLFRYGILVAYLSGVAAWFALNVPITTLKPDIIFALVISTVLFAISINFFHHQPHRKLASFKSDKLDTLIRAVFAGSFIALAVICSKLFGPVWGGMFASFPAAFSATVLIFSRAHGGDFTASVSRTMASGAFANVIFVSVIYFLVGTLGAAASIAAGYLICLVFAVFSYRHIIPRI